MLTQRERRQIEKAITEQNKLLEGSDDGTQLKQRGRIAAKFVFELRARRWIAIRQVKTTDENAVHCAPAHFRDGGGASVSGDGRRETPP